MRRKAPKNGQPRLDLIDFGSEILRRKRFAGDLKRKVSQCLSKTSQTRL